MGFNKFGGFGGGNMQQLIKQAQKMQQDMLAAQEEVAQMEVTGTSGGGLVEVVLKADKSAIVSLKIKPEAVDPDDVEMLEDLVVAAIGDAFSKADAYKEEKMSAYAGLGL